jgi:Alkaline phosphatase PhoX
MRDRSIGCAALAAALAAAVAASPAAAEQPGIEGDTGPSTVVPPYVQPAAPGVRTAALLTTGDSVGGYRMAGVPDGLGAYRTDGGELRLLMNHEINDTSGIVRRHGANGSFVSDWTIDRRSFAVTAGADLIAPGVRFWDYGAGAYSDLPGAGFTAVFDRFCSNTLTDKGQLFNDATGNGYTGRLFFPSEENGDSGRAFAVTTDGRAQQLPRLGLLSSENTVPAHNASDTTLVMGNEDEADGQLRAYVGTKRADGDPFDRAGLTDGVPAVVSIAEATTDAGFRAAIGKHAPVRFALRTIDWTAGADAQQAEAHAKGLTLDRIEDGHWDPSHPRDYYFLTTEGGVGADTPTGRYGRDGGGLWRLRFDDIERPERGGTLTLLLDGSEPPLLNKPDNMTIDARGNLLIQEDPGNNVMVSRIVAYRIADGARAVLARFDPRLFGWRGGVLPNGNPVLDADQLTFDEESSGIIDARATIGPRWFLFDAQVHRASPDPELVQGGQLLSLHVDNWGAVYDSAP